MKLPFRPSRRRSRAHGSETSHGVVLRPGTSGSSLLLDALAHAARTYPAVLGSVHLPSDKATFKRTFDEVLVRFEARRTASPERVAIARDLLGTLNANVVVRAGDAVGPLADHLALGREAVPVTTVGGRGEPRSLGEIPWRRQIFREAPGLNDLVLRMRDENLVTDDACAGLRWMADRVADGRLDLRGERFALLGAGAELAPTQLLLDAGADVLWIDRAPPSARLLAGDFPGRLHIVAPADLLADPGLVRQAILDFAEAGPVHLGLYAYAPGKGRELRLAAVMDAIATSLPAGVARSVSMLVSPTTPGEVRPEDREAASRKRAGAEVWKRALERAGLLPPHGHETVGAATISRSVVTLQGAAYQAAQYLAKMMSAEALLADGIGGTPVTVSANVAGITATRSLLHPLFQAGFLLAPRFGIEIYEPATTRSLAGLLMLHDVLNERAPGAAHRAAEPPADRARALTAQAMHGGTRALPWVLEPTIRVAAVIGLGKKPSLLRDLIAPKKKKA